MKKLYLTVMMMIFLVGNFIYAQNITGTVMDAETNEALVGASVMVKGTDTGTVSDIEGKFTISGLDAGEYEIAISYLGYQTMTLSANTTAGSVDLGAINLSEAGVGLESVVIVGVADIAQDRKTPVAVSTISSTEITRKLGNQELPELLKTTPSIYATKQGGGFGDSRINVRGFTQENTAVLINGVPVNDMENGRVFWSNWTGLAEVATAMQVQRGLGSSKLAISSVGGTVNIITKTTDLEKGGSVGFAVGNDGYLRTSASYSTGRMENGMATSLLLSRKSGDGYANGTSFEGYNFFFGLGWSDDENKHSVQFTVTGAPQVHNQRTTSFFNMATLEDYLDYGTKYNYNHGYLNGEEFNWRRNFYHKPVASINWDYNISDKMSLSSVVYASYGRGGGTGDIGRLPGFKFASSSIYRDQTTGEVMWDKIVSYNQGNAVTFSDGEVYQRDDAVNGQFINESSNHGLTRRASINSHNWFGAIVNLNNQVSDNLSFDIGLDLRSYKGIHYRRVDNLLGADAYLDDDNINGDLQTSTTYSSEFSSIVNVFKSIDDDEKIDYYNDGLVRWSGAFGQVEYSNDIVTAFVQGAVSNQGFKRIDYFNYLDSDPAQTTDWKNLVGGNIKAGLNYNLDENNNVFFNAGYYSKQPNFDAVYLDFLNNLNPDLINEKVVGLEAGYGYRSGNLRANVNLYRTAWSDRFFQEEVELSNGLEGVGTFNGLEQVHMGLEIDGSYRASSKLRVNAMVSLNNWEYNGNVEADIFDDDMMNVGTYTLFVDGIKVGDAAQFTSRLGLDYKPISRLTVSADWFRADKLYADFLFRSGDFAEDFGSEEVEIVELPAYDLFDLGIYYSLLIGADKQQSLSFGININNVFDTEYLSESKTNILADSDASNNWNGINKRNKVFFGFGRTWNASVKYSF